MVVGRLGLMGGLAMRGRMNVGGRSGISVSSMWHGR